METTQEKTLEVKTLALKATNLFSDIIIDYTEGKDSLRPYYGHTPDLVGFEQYVYTKQFPSERREVLIQHLKDQYSAAEISLSKSTKTNIDLLADNNTFTVTTGHQLNLFTGPLYFIYKIASTIQLAKSLKNQFPDKNFVPVYWMASEDHDFEEISHFRLFKDTYTWNTDQKGAVGKIESDGLNEIIEAIGELPEFIKSAYKAGNTLSKATMELVNNWFGKYGLVILDADAKALKNSFSPIIKSEILNNQAATEVEHTTNELQELGYKSQVNPREINFFYLDDQLRSRIIQDEKTGNYSVLDTEIQFTKDELVSEIENHPEKFSPNVIMRPVYQEYILPNLAYIGGPGEIHYWLQLKSCFEHYQVDFPILMLRDFILVLNGSTSKKLSKLDMSVEDIFRDFYELKKEINDKNSNSEQILTEAEKGLNEVFIKLEGHIPEEGTKKFIDSHRQNTLNQFKKVENKINKYFDSLNETSIRQLESIKDYAFPNGSPQERVDNVLNFLLNNDRFIDEIIPCCNPLDKSYKVIFA